MPRSKFLGAGKPLEVFEESTLQRVFRARHVLLRLMWSQLVMRDQAARKAEKQP